MAQAANADAQVENEAEGADALPATKKWSGKRLVMIIVPVVLLVGGAAAVFMTGMFDKDKPAEEGNEAVAEAAPPQPSVFYQLPEMLVNLNSPGRRVNFLKIKISLELSKQEDVARLEGVMPRIVDNFQVYLREMRIEDLQGSAGMVRLREELLMRVRAAAEPAVVNDVLFTEMLVQ